MKSDFIELEGLSVHVKVYNPEAEKTVICWHGLARCGADFDYLARALANNYRVICPDTPGRGLSEWVADSDYGFHLYVPLAKALIAHYNISQLSWVGTSMGGLLGILLAADDQVPEFNHFVINDIGPEVPDSALARIVEYVGQTIPFFDAFPRYVDYMKELYGCWGPRSEAQWQTFAQYSSRRTDKGQFTVHYHPTIVGQFDPEAPKVNLWPQFDAIRCPLMLIQGSVSDVLPDELFQRMCEHQPSAKPIVFAGLGHAPGLHTPEQIDPVVRFLNG